MSYNTTATLAGLPAYSVQHTGVNVNNSTITVLDVGTIISGKLLVAHYITDPPSFSTFLPTALKIINSLRIDKAAIYSLEISHPSRQISIMILCADYTDSNFLNYSVNILDRFFSKYGNLVYLVYITNYK